MESASHQPVCRYLKVETDRVAHGACIHLHGELDLGSVRLVAEEILALEQEGLTPIVLDMAGVSFLDCSGLSVLVGAMNRAARDDRRVEIKDVQPGVRRIFRLTGCQELLAGSPREPSPS